MKEPDRRKYFSSIEDPYVEGGQGRTNRQTQDSGAIVGYCALIAVALLAVVIAIALKHS